MHRIVALPRPRRSRALLVPVLLLAGPLAAQPSASRLLRQLEERYTTVVRYHDRGEIVRTVFESGVAREQERYRFETARLNDRFLLRLEAEADPVEIRIWRQGTESFHDRVPGGRRIVPTPSTGLADLLGWGDETHEALIVPLLLAEPEAARLSVGAAAAAGNARVEAGVACGRRRCDVVVADTLGEAMQTRIAIDPEEGWVRSVGVRLLATGDVLAAAMADVGLRRSDRPAGNYVRIEVRHLEVDEEPESAFAAASRSEPPAPSRVGGRDRGPTSSAPAAQPSASRSPAERQAAGQPDPDVVFREEIEVVEVTTRVRVVSWSGEPVLDLLPEDFRVRAGKVEVPVVAVDWVSSEQPPGWDIPPEVRARYDIVVDPPGKMVLFFVQADLLAIRGKGHLKLLPEADRLLSTFGREDWVAVASFDSHLKLRQDFTHNHELVADALRRAIRVGKSPPPVAGLYPSLGRYLDEREAKRVATAERALLKLAEALGNLPGEKVVVYVGWGLGRYGSGGWRQRPEYDATRLALLRANATVFVLDITQADYHTLELGLREIAEHTGGTYEKTFHFQSQATGKLAATLEGYYLLTLEPPPGLRDNKRLKVTVPDVKGRVLQTPTYVGGQR